MKRVLAFLLVLLMLTPVALSEGVDISSLTIEELLLLRQSIDLKLKELGYYPYILLEKNATGEDVTALQERLKELKYYTSDITGKYDSNTIAAMKAFEKANNLTQDGKASVDEQRLLFSAKAKPMPTPTPKPTKKPTPTPKPTKTPDPRKAYGTFNFKDAARYPEYYSGLKVKIVGRVLQVMGNKTDGFQLRVASKGNWDNVVYIIVKNARQNILEKDKINFYCRLAGNTSYTSVMGAEITLPLLVCDFYEFR